jgi:hypothetical protein
LRGAIDFFPRALTDVGDEQRAVERVDVEAERIPEPVGPDQTLVRGRRGGERIVGGCDEAARCGAGAGRQPRHVESQDHAAQTRRVLRRAWHGILTEAHVQHAVGTESQRSTVVIKRGVWNVVDES